MKIQYKGQYFYVLSGPEYATEMPAEEWVGVWRNIDETRRIEITQTAQITEVVMFPDLWEVHLYIRGRKTPKQYKFPDADTYSRFIQFLQSGLNFDLM